MDSDEDDFITIGSCLEAIGEDEVRKKPVRVSDQKATDNEGRVRFHGAFTGGFSAGYFNTVGTKEGWTPSTFKSSRSERSTKSAARPEDFMDDEDFGEFGIAPRQIKTADSYKSANEQRHPMTGQAGDLIESSLSVLIVPERTSIGMKLLTKLGWKSGQGVGPRLKRKKRHRIYGCPPSGETAVDEESSSDDDQYRHLTFAPKDVCPILFTPKDNVHGMGYSGLVPTSALSCHVTTDHGIKGRKRSIKGQAFGVGVLEEDDEDIYSLDHLSNYDQTMELDSSGTFGWTRPNSQNNSQRRQASHLSDCLEGFHLSTVGTNDVPTFPPPTIPRNFTPVHVFKTQSDTTFERRSTEPQARVSRMTAIDRGVLLGETPHISSVFELVSDSDKRKLPSFHDENDAPRTEDIASKSVSLSGNAQGGLLSNEKLSLTALTNTVADTDDQPSLVLSASTISTNSLHPKPFAKDPAKQARYEKYSTLVSSGNKDPYSLVSGSHMTEWEREREANEFQRAVKLFRPLSTMMSSRFTTGKFDDDPASLMKSETTDTNSESRDLAAAVELGMFGRITHEQYEWHPSKLLCKRFNVPPPYPESNVVGLPGKKVDKVTVFNFLDHSASWSDTKMDQDPPKPIAATMKSTPASKPNIFESYFKAQDEKHKKLLQPKSTAPKPSESEEKNIDEQKLSEPPHATNIENPPTSQSLMDSQNNDTQVSADKPSMDLFKAIFANSDVSSEDEDDPDEIPTQSASNQADTEGSESSSVALMALSVPLPSTVTDIPRVPDAFGVTSSTGATNPSTGSVTSEFLPNDTNQSTDCFGPKLPPKYTEDSSVDRSLNTITQSMSHHIHKHSHRKHKKKKRKKSEHDHRKDKKKRAKEKSRRTKVRNKSDSDSSMSSDTEIFHRLKDASKQNISLRDLL